MKKLCLTVLALLLLCASALGETRIMVVSDVHYLARELYEGSELFLRALSAGDGKIPQYGDELLEALVLETEHVRPDALAVTGDLTLNGERLSHEGLAAYFARIEEAGTPVWIIPGNHDINEATPRAYEGNGWHTVPGADEAAFAEIYADFLLPPEGGANMSYHVPVSDTLWLAMTDVSVYGGKAQVYGRFGAAHERWLRGVLEEAEAAGAEVVTATHHSLVPHSAYAQENYVMVGARTMRETLRGRTRLNLSGHLHIQHIAEEDGVADAATAAFCNAPHRYGLVTLGDDGSLTYEARALCDGHLPEGFQAMSLEWFLGVTKAKTLRSLAQTEIDPEDAERMADFSARFHLAYFDGSYDPADPAWSEDPGMALWEAHPEGGLAAYIRTAAGYGGGSNLYLRLEAPAKP